MKENSVIFSHEIYKFPNQSFTDGLLLNPLEFTDVTLIQKEEDSLDKENYRNVSILDLI